MIQIGRSVNEMKSSDQNRCSALHQIRQYYPYLEIQIGRSVNDMIQIGRSVNEMKSSDQNRCSALHQIRQYYPYLEIQIGRSVNEMKSY